MAEIGLPASSPHSVTGVPLRSPASAICLQHAQERHRQRIEAVGELRVAAVGRHDELEQVVGADRDEIDRRHQLVELAQQRRHFEHGAELQAGRQMVGEARQMPHLLVDDLARLRDLAKLGDHRQHERSSRPPAALSSARICVRSRPGRSSVSRIARQPSAGFSSSVAFLK